MKYTTEFCIKFATNIILLCINHNFSRVLLTALRAFKKTYYFEKIFNFS